MDTIINPTPITSNNPSELVLVIIVAGAGAPAGAPVGR